MSIYVNRILNLKRIRVIGFDMDHTLVRYHSAAIEKFVFYEVLKKLHRIKKYPSDILHFSFDYDKVIRGLVFDKARGNLLKLSLYGDVKMGFHGLKPLTFETMRQTYKGLQIDVSQPDYYSLDTTFAISMALLFSVLVDFKDRVTDPSFSEKLTYLEIFNDIEEMIDITHQDGSLKGEIHQNLSKYVIQDPAVYEMLKTFKAHNKTLAIITNSDYAYTKLMLDYTIKPFLPASTNWSELFDFIITLADKPRFFSVRSRFLKVDRDSALMSNWHKPLEKGIYQGGCAREFQKQLGVKGDQILYLGDHIYGDIVTLKKNCDWKTGLVVEELGQEIASLQKGEDTQKDLDQLMEEKEALEILLSESNEETGRTVYHKIRQLDKKITEKLLTYQSFFNPFWGSIMRAGQEESRLANQIERYACIYMSKITDMINYSPRHYFRPKRRPLPHECFKK